jgi:RNA polymerase sigma-70 factor (ECF subfamily)
MDAVGEDRELVERLRQGDRDALRLIYEKHKHDLLRIGGCMAANWTDAEDCLHDVFVSLAANSARIRPDGNLKGYLVTAMANRSRDRLRARKRSHQIDEVAGRTDCELVAPAIDPAAAMFAAEADDRLYRAIASLPAEQRTVITLRLHGELTFEEIAQLENVSNNTIRSRYRYGLDKLRSSLGAGVER